MPTHAVITGGSGRIATMLRPHLAERGWIVTLVDTRAPDEPLGPGESFLQGSVLDDAVLDAAVRRDLGAAGPTCEPPGPSGARSPGSPVDVVVHLAAIPQEAAWEDILAVNVDGTRRVLEAAQKAGVRRVLLASSVHAVGFTPLAETGAADVLLPRPDTYYGFSKAAGEALGSLYADRFGMGVVSARIVNGVPAPTPRQGAWGRIAWFSPGDAARLVAATVALEEPGHHVVWGVSRAGGRWFPLEAGRRIGYDPQDDAEEPGDAQAAVDPLAGMGFTRMPLGRPFPT